MGMIRIVELYATAMVIWIAHDNVKYSQLYNIIYMYIYI